MKTYIKTLFFAVLAMAATMVSCEKPDGIGTPVQDAAGLVELTFAVNADTKTALGEDGQAVEWKADDVLRVYDGTQWNDFTIPAADFVEGSSSAKFTGTANDVETYYVVCSSAAPATFTPVDGTYAAYVTGVTIPNEQVAVNGTYDPSSHVSIGVATRAEGASVTDPVALEMMNACALAKVTLKGSDIRSVTISTTDENMYLSAGGCKVVFNDSKSIYAQSDRLLSVSLVSGTEDAIAPGDYYLAMIPRKLTNVSVTYTKTDGSSATVTSTMPAPAEGEEQQYYNFERSKIVPLGIDDTALEYVKEEEPQYPDPLVLTIDCSNGQPFTENISTSSSDYEKTAKTWILLQDGIEYPFVILGSKGYRFVSSSIRLNEGGVGATAIQLPAIPEMKLVSVYVNVTNSASDTGKEIMISKTQSNTKYIDTFAFAKTDDDVKEHTFALTGTVAGKGYYVVGKHAKTQVAKLVATYNKVTE